MKVGTLILYNSSIEGVVVARTDDRKKVKIRYTAPRWGPIPGKTQKERWVAAGECKRINDAYEDPTELDSMGPGAILEKLLPLQAGEERFQFNLSFWRHARWSVELDINGTTIHTKDRTSALEAIQAAANKLSRMLDDG